MRPERGQASVVAPPLCETSGTSTKVYDASQLENSPKFFAASGRSSATVTKKPVLSHEVAEPI
jgi:hypothetical protein